MGRRKSDIGNQVGGREKVEGMRGMEEMVSDALEWFREEAGVVSGGREVVKSGRDLYLR